MAEYGARTPSAQGNYGIRGPRAPGATAPPAAPTSDLYAARGGGRESTEATHQETSAYTPPAGPPSLQTPSVNRDGTIPPPAAPAPYQPPPAGGGTPYQMNSANEIGPGNGAITGGQNQQVSAQGSMGGGGSFTPPSLGPLSDPFWSNYVKNNIDPRALSQENLALYSGQTAPQYQNQLDPRVGQAQNDLMLRVLQNPESMGPQVVAGMKEAQKESALKLRQQLMGANTQGAIGRGTFGSGYSAGQGRNIGDSVASDITRAYRDIDTSAATTNFADRLAALTSADQMQSGVTQRGIGNYQAGLQGQQFNADERFREYGSDTARTQFGYQRTLDEANLQNQAVQNALQAWSTSTQEGLGREGLNLDWARFGGSDLDWASLMNNMQMGRMNYGLGVAQLGQNAQNSMFNFLRPGG